VTAAGIPTAATVVVLRESGEGLEVLLTRRAAALSFMGGLWVFPGGRMEPCDHAAAMLRRVRGATAAAGGLQDIEGGPLAAELVLGLRVAACRETFEEAGVLLARRSDGDALSDDQLERVAGLRAQAAHADGFLQLLEREGLELDVDRLVYWSHWITPSAEPKRFDTRFFAVRVPERQRASVDQSELTQHAWLAETSIRQHLASGEMQMAPPTLATLEDLWSSHRRHGGLEAMLAAERNRDVPPILPKLQPTPDGGGFEVILPWDADYASAPGEGCAIRARYPGYLLALPSRRRFRRR
jgi:8-oxo-dGTP pyrophosphatase MutT (NUDIX family)